jgi:hypothetical protein
MPPEESTRGGIALHDSRRTNIAATMKKHLITLYNIIEDRFQGIRQVKRLTAS